MTNCLQLMAFLLLAYCHPSLCAANEWLGTEVFFKDTAVAMVGTEVVEKYKVLTFPATVGEVNGEWLWLGRAWVKKSDCMNLDQAFIHFDEQVRKTPTSASAWTNLAIALRTKGELDSAINGFDEAIRIDPKYAIAYCNRGIAKSMLKDFVAAIKDYDEAIRLDPKYAFAYNNRGNAKGDLEENTAAIEDYDEAIRIDPKYAHAYRNRGISKVFKEDFTAAIKDYDEAIRLDPKQPHAKNNKAFLLSTAEDARVRNPDLALKLAEEVLSVDPSNAEGMNAKSCALAAKGDYTSAIALQESITDSAWLKNYSIVGGVHAKARIAAWKSGKLWHP